MIRKYDARICGKCGSIHFVPNSDLDAAIEMDKELWLVCGGCGRTSCIGADKETDWYGGDRIVYNMYCAKRENYTLTEESFNPSEKTRPVHKVIHSKGIRPVMMTGMHATHYFAPAGRFEDNWYPDMWRVKRNDITPQELIEFIDKWEKDRVTVNMPSLLRVLTDEECEALSAYHIEGLDWTGTKYERPWHKKQ